MSCFPTVDERDKNGTRAAEERERKEEMAGMEGYKRRGNWREGAQRKERDRCKVVGNEGSVNQACGHSDREREQRGT